MWQLGDWQTPECLMFGHENTSPHFPYLLSCTWMTHKDSNSAIRLTRIKKPQKWTRMMTYWLGEGQLPRGPSVRCWCGHPLDWYLRCWRGKSRIVCLWLNAACHYPRGKIYILWMLPQHNPANWVDMLHAISKQHYRNKHVIELLVNRLHVLSHLDSQISFFGVTGLVSAFYLLGLILLFKRSNSISTFPILAVFTSLRGVCRLK